MAPAEASSSTSSPPGTINMNSSSNDGIDSRPVVAVDVDEVLGHFVPQLCKFYNVNYTPEPLLTPDMFTCYQFHEVWGGTREEADEKMRLFFNSSHFLEGDSGDGIPVVAGAADILRKYVKRLDLHIVTSRQNILRGHTVAWVNANYPGIFTKLHFGNHHSLEGEVRSKPDLCQDINAVMIIDDNMRYAMQCAEAGIRTCLFGNYAWNHTSEELPSNVHRTLSWDDVDKALASVASDADTAAESSRAQTEPQEMQPDKGSADNEMRDGQKESGPSSETDREDREEAVENENSGKSGGTPTDGGGGIDGADDGTDVEDSRVVVVEASKKVPDLVDMATERLVHHEAVCLRSLEKGHSLGVDAVQELERLGIAMKTSIKTSLVELTSGSRTCVEITVARTPKFSDGLIVAAGGGPVPESVPAAEGEELDNNNAVGDGSGDIKV